MAGRTRTGGATHLGQRLTRALVALALVCAAVVAVPGTASASTGGTATANGLTGNIAALTVLGLPVTTGIPIDLVSVGTPAPNAAGVGIQTATLASVNVLGVVQATAVSGTTVRTTGGLSSSADVTGLSVNLFGVEIVGADVIGSQVACAITELPTPNSASVDPLVGLTVANNGVALDVLTSVPVNIGVPGTTAFIDVRVSQPVSTGPPTATATGLAIDANLRVRVGPFTILNATIIDLDIARSTCTRPAGSVPTTTSLVPDTGPEGTVVTVNGAGFIPGQTSVGFGGLTIPAADVTVNTTPATAYGTSLTFTVPDDAPLGATPVTVTTPVGTSSPALTFTVTAAPPTAASLTPPAGPEGTVVTVLGDNFIPGATTVALGATAIPAGAVTVGLDGNSLTFTVPPGTPLGPTTVVATTVGGSTAPLAFTVLPLPPTTVDLTPPSGPEGTTVTVNGTNFVPGSTTVDFGGVTIPAGDVTVAPGGASLTFDVPDDSPLGATSVIVTTDGGVTSPALTFTVTEAPPVADDLTPDNGPEGTTVTVNGDNFVPGATSVTFGGITIPASAVTVALDGNSLTFDVPDDSPLGATDVVVDTAGGSTDPLTFTVTEAPPTATSLTPDSGPEGTTVTVFGDNFVPGATTVDFGGVTIPVGEVDVAGDGNSLTFVVPDDSPLGATDVVVDTAGGGTTPPLTFTVTAAVPVALGLLPDNGPESTTVFIDGDDFVPGATTITFGSVTIPAADVIVALDGDTLAFDVPDDSPLGATVVVVNTPGGSSDPLTFTVTEAVPVADDLTPTSGPELTTVTVNGDNFVPGATTVDFGGVTIPAGDVIVALDGNSLTFDVPDDSPLGATDVVVTTAGGSTDPLTFTVTAAVPTAASLTPPSGTEGITVTVNGDNFIPGSTTVTFGSATIVAADVTVASDGDSLTFVVPLGSPLGATTVVASTIGGSTGPLTFTVVPLPPTAASLTPPSGPEETVVTVTGTNFVPGATTVQFGSQTIAAADVTVASDGESLTFVVPINSPLGATTVVATTTGGSTGPLSFTVTAVAPTATSLTPPSGPEGTVVTVNGDHFLSGATTVQLGTTTIPASAVTVALDGNSLTFVVPDDFPIGPTTVVVTTPGGSTEPLAFTVTVGAPIITGIDPVQGPVGTTVTIVGDNFVPGETAVVIGDTLIPPGAVTVAPDGDSLTFVVPVGTPIGAQTVRVITVGGTSAPGTFTVTGPGTTPVSPDGALPYTGTDTAPLLLTGVFLALLGLGLWLVSTAGRTHVVRVARVVRRR